MLVWTSLCKVSTAIDAISWREETSTVRSLTQLSKSANINGRIVAIVLGLAVAASIGSILYIAVEQALAGILPY